MIGIRDAQAKLAWAKGHLDLLDREINLFANANAYTLSRDDNLENQLHVMRFSLNEVPDPICLIAGDAVYNMRSSLDQLVWALACQTVHTPKRTAFPIIDGPALTKSRLESFNRSLADVPREAICEIDALQPYHRGAAFKRHPLWRLDEMCNLDKHRRIPANGSASVLHFPNLSKADRAAGIPRVDVTDEGFVITVPIALKEKLDTEDTMHFAVEFGGDVSGISEGFNGLMEIYKFVAESVLPRFERFFK